MLYEYLFLQSPFLGFEFFQTLFRGFCKDARFNGFQEIAQCFARLSKVFFENVQGGVFFRSALIELHNRFDEQFSVCSIVYGAGDCFDDKLLQSFFFDSPEFTVGGLARGRAFVVTINPGAGHSRVGTQVFAAVAAPDFSAEQILNACNVLAVPVGVEFCFYGLVQIDGNDLRIGFRKDFITETVNACVLLVIQ